MKSRIIACTCILLIAALLVSCGRQAQKNPEQQVAREPQGAPVPPTPPPAVQQAPKAPPQPVSPDDVVLPSPPSTNQTMPKPVSPDAVRVPVAPPIPTSPGAANGTNGSAPAAGRSVSPDDVVIPAP